MKIVGGGKWWQIVKGDGVENGGKWWRLVGMVVESGGNAIE